MVLITRDEAEYLRAHSKKVRITTTARGKNSRQKKRYADEVGDTFRLLKRYRNGRK